jgi:branched-chain amino acid transport system permease protein
MRDTGVFRRIPMKDWIFTLFVAAVVVFIAIQAVFGFSVYYVHFISNLLIFGIVSMAFNFLYGFGGLLSLATAGFYMVGAYGGMLAIRYVGNNFYVGLLGSLVVTAIFSLMVGAVASRIRGVYFFLITFGFSMLPYLLIKGPTREVTGGQTGMHIRELPSFFFDLKNPYYYLVFVLLLLIAIYVLLRCIIASPFGRNLRCIKENELKLSSLGYNTWWNKTMAVTISGTLTGFAGYLYLLKNLSISPVLGTYFMSAKVVLCALIGGMSTFVGPLVGSLVWYLIEEFLVQPGFLEIILGFALVVVILRFPQGLIGEFLKSREIKKKG